MAVAWGDGCSEPWKRDNTDEQWTGHRASAFEIPNVCLLVGLKVDGQSLSS